MSSQVTRFDQAKMKERHKSLFNKSLELGSGVIKPTMDLASQVLNPTISVIQNVSNYYIEVRRNEVRLELKQ